MLQSILMPVSIFVLVVLVVIISKKYGELKNQYEMCCTEYENEQNRCKNMENEKEFFRKESYSKTEDYNRLLSEYDKTKHRLNKEVRRLQESLQKQSSYTTHLEMQLKKVATEQQWKQIIKENKKWQ